MSLSASGRIRRANEIKAELISLLGGQCEGCSTTTDLEFNHIYGRNWKVRSLTRYRRMLRYRKEAALNLIDLRCEECNRAYRPVQMPSAASAVMEPF